MKVVSLFAGIGGFDLALERLGHEIVYANEWNKYAAQIYEKHFKKPDTRDIKTVATSEIPDHDLLVGGFPCQSFSIAGKRKGFDDTRGTLFFDIARILKDKRPRYFLLENVKGLLNHQSGETFQTILEVLADLRYSVQWRICNSKEFGVAQNRERVIIVGSIAGEPPPQVFSFPGAEQENHEAESHQEGVRASTLTARQYANWNGNFIRQLNHPKHSNDRVYSPDGIAPTLNTMQGGRRQPFVALSEKRTEEAKEIRRKALADGKDFSPRRGKYLEPRTDGKIGTITASRNLDNLVSDTVSIRRLTPLECERLQGFPDGWTEGISETQRYKCLGNAVTVNVIYHVAKGFSPVPGTSKNIQKVEATKHERFKYERRYPYICNGCNKKRWTRKYDRRADEVCTKCERNGISDNQLSLLPVTEQI